MSHKNMRVPDSFASRMKEYETTAQQTLLRRTPVIMRMDGKGFSNLTRGMKKPFDEDLASCMYAATLRVLAEAQNVRLAYVQSDEISLLLTDFRQLGTEPWFGNSVQKLCSVGAAFTTAGFCEMFMQKFVGLCRPGRLPVFDARCFNLPREEVTNYFVWRQRDCERNSVSMTAQAHFSHKELQGLNKLQMVDMLQLQRGVDWSALPSSFRSGAVFTRELVSWDQGSTTRARWTLADAPIFSRERDFVERFLREEEDRT